MVATKDEHKSTVSSWGRDLSDEQRKLVSQGLDDIVKNDMPVRDALGIDPKLIQHIYSVGYQMYNTGRFVQASQVFRLLLFLDGLKLKYLMGLGASYHMMKNYPIAAEI